MSTLRDFTVLYDSAWDTDVDTEQEFIPNESPEGALEFVIADRQITPREGDMAYVIDEAAHDTTIFEADIDEVTGRVVFDSDETAVLA